MRTKNFLLALLSFICLVNGYGQTLTRNYYGRIDVIFTKEKKPKRIYAKVEIKSAFPGGDSSWVQSLENRISQSIRPDRRVKKGKYIVSVQFVIAKDSSISDVRCLNDPGFGMGKQVVRALIKGQPWRPAPYQGTPVGSYRRSAVTVRDEER